MRKIFGAAGMRAAGCKWARGSRRERFAGIQVEPFEGKIVSRNAERHAALGSNLMFSSLRADILGLGAEAAGATGHSIFEMEEW